MANLTPVNKIEHREGQPDRYRRSDKKGKRHELTQRVRESDTAFLYRVLELDRAIDDGKNLDTMSFDELFNSWVRRYATPLCTKWDIDDMNYTYEQRVKDHIGDILIDKITPADCEDLLLKAIKDDVPSYVSKIRAVISRPYNWGIVRYNLPIANPMVNVRIRLKRSATDKRNEAISIDDAERIFEQALDTHYENALKIMWLIGLRPSEVLGLQINDIKDDHLEIRRGVTKYGLSNLKTPKSKRDIKLFPALKNVLDNQKERTKSGIWLFPSPTQPVPDMVSFANWYMRMKRQTEVKKPRERDSEEPVVILVPKVESSLYSFRHSFITRALESGMSLKAVQVIAGHDDPATTLKYYQEFTPKMANEAASEMNNLKTPWGQLGEKLGEADYADEIQDK